tara:strand:- start:3276 stop:3788 length:513 start_codon:yes stop_codon:yes gene_type:complete
MESPINPQYVEYVNDTRDQILSDLNFENDLDALLYFQEHNDWVTLFIKMLNKHGWCFYHSIDEEVIPVIHWKSIRESYPPEKQRVLVLTMDKEIKIGYMHTPFEDREWSLDNDNKPYGLSHVTHWQELPEFVGVNDRTNEDVRQKHREELNDWLEEDKPPENLRGALGNL